jgi:MFS superfamily sulfate permease-like transporter
MPVIAYLNRLLPGLQPLLKYRAADLAARRERRTCRWPRWPSRSPSPTRNWPASAPPTGLYASILPMVVYALAGTSRQMIIGPDAATCAMIAAVVAPLAAGNSGLYLSFSIALTLLTGIFCLAASFLRLGALADFLARPILVGLLNGVSLSIMIGQIGKVLGSKPEASRFFRQLLEIPELVLQAHWPTVLLSLGCVAVMRSCRGCRSACRRRW